MDIIVAKDLTPVIQYDTIKFENQCYEMLNATVSHDMRTPLNAILGLIEAVEPFVKGDQGRRLLSIINNSANMLLFLVNDMLDLFQIKNGKF
jgi:signal transduction histidine kinase